MVVPKDRKVDPLQQNALDTVPLSIWGSLGKALPNLCGVGNSCVDLPPGHLVLLPRIGHESGGRWIRSVNYWSPFEFLWKSNPVELLEF